MSLQERDQEIFAAIEQERGRQHQTLELIASENFVSEEVMQAMGSVLTNKYAEGYPGKRYCGGRAAAVREQGRSAANKSWCLSCLVRK